jgi:hypothetical protein
MSLTTREEILLKRGLDKASSQAEVEMCAKRSAAEWRKWGSSITDSEMIELFMEDRRAGITGYQVIDKINRRKQVPITPQPSPVLPPIMEVSKPNWWEKLKVLISFGWVFWEKSHTPITPPTTEERIKAERIERIDNAIQTLQDERDELDPPQEPDGPDYP